SRMTDDRSDMLRHRNQELREESLALVIRALRAHAIANVELDRCQRERDRLQHELVDLRKSILVYAESLRRLGEPVHFAIERVRHICDDAVRAAPGGAQADRTAREALVNDVILWTVDAYAA